MVFNKFGLNSITGLYMENNSIQRVENFHLRSLETSYYTYFVSFCTKYVCKQSAQFASNFVSVRLNVFRTIVRHLPADHDLKFSMLGALKKKG